ncbi:MAG: FkbM family methyltransferase [Bacteroidetes bacterium]|nr:FkbM family methyltransferase [Bacteroidota bacterium]
MGFLKNKEAFKYHYAVKKLIKPTDCVVDIGANLGYFAKTFARLTPKGHLTCIEPIPPFYEVLKRNLKKFEHVTLFHTALGDENGTIKMVLPKSNGMIRTGLPHIPAANEDITGLESISVMLTKTSELFSKITPVDYIKCDVEGYEWTVFQQLETILKKHFPTIQIEIAEENIEVMHSFFTQMGYEQYGIVDFQIVRDELPQNEKGDFLFVHPSRKSHLSL